MDLTYRVEPEDVGAVAEYTFKRSPHFRRYHVQWLCIGLVITGLLVCFFVVVAPLPYPVLLGTLCVLGWPMFYWWRAPMKYRHYVEQVLTEDHHDGVFGLHRIAADPHGFTEHTAVNHTSYAWTDIPHIRSIPGCTIIHTTAASAFVIPAHRVEAGDYETFVNTIARWHRESRASAQ